MTDTTRPHPRIERREAPGLRLPLETGALFVPARLRPRDSVSLVVQFHGAPWLVEHHIAGLRGTVGIAIQLGAGSGVYSRAFSDASRFLRLLDEAQRALAAAWRRPVRWKRVTLASFSAGYGAIREILKDQQCHARFDDVLLADSLHTSYRGDARPGLDIELLEPFMRLARETAGRDSRKSLTLTHSEVFPGTFAGTTETADALLAAVELKRAPLQRQGPLGMQQLSRARRGRFQVLGFAGNSAPDHMDHLYALGVWLKGIRQGAGF